VTQSPRPARRRREFLLQLPGSGFIVGLARIHVSRGTRIPAPRMHIFPARAALQEEFAAGVKDENVDRPMEQFLPMDFVTGSLAGHAIVGIHHVENLPVDILGVRSLRRRRLSP